MLCKCGCGEETTPRRTFRRGHNARVFHPAKGKPMPPKAKEALLAFNRGRVEEASSSWKGDDVGYPGLHAWVQKERPRTGICQHCGAAGGRTHNANISGEYRRDLDDFIEVCGKCHYRHYATPHDKRWQTRQVIA